MNRTTIMAAVLLLSGAASVPAQGQNAFVSSYLQGAIGYGGEAAKAVACGFRTPEWGQHLHDVISAILSQHAGAPFDKPHKPTDQERGVGSALACSA